MAGSSTIAKTGKCCNRLLPNSNCSLLSPFCGSDDGFVKSRIASGKIKGMSISSFLALPSMSLVLPLLLSYAVDQVLCAPCTHHLSINLQQFVVQSKACQKARLGLDRQCGVFVFHSTSRQCANTPQRIPKGHSTSFSKLSNYVENLILAFLVCSLAWRDRVQQTSNCYPQPVILHDNNVGQFCRPEHTT